jgi:LTXXQ motif family protein
MKAIAVGLFALLVASASAQAQNATVGVGGRLTQGDINVLTDARIAVIKSTLQLTSDQEKLWPAIESATRARAKDRQERLQSVVERVEERSERSTLENLRDRNPVELMRRRADTMAQRAADLKKLADAWQPLYESLTPDQKRRMGTLAIVVIRDLRDSSEQRRLQDF